MKVTLKQKRFLIVWICFHSFALFVNIAGIYGELPSDGSIITHDSFGTKIYTSHENNLFTSSNYKEDFWPFTTYYKKEYYQPDYSDGILDNHYFYGIFTSYDYSEYIFYILLGFAVVYMPKLWNE